MLTPPVLRFALSDVRLPVIRESSEPAKLKAPLAEREDYSASPALPEVLKHALVISHRCLFCIRQSVGFLHLRFYVGIAVPIVT